MKMWKTEVNKKANTSKEKIWQLWQDVPNWNTWDSSIEYSKIDGEFNVETTGVLKPKGGPKTKFIITDTVENFCFTNQSKLPFCTIEFIHELKESNQGILITHRIEMKGILSSFFAKVMGKNMAKELPLAVDNLIKLAENER